MKKSIKSLALALAALGLVTGCTINGNSSKPASSASGSDSSSQSSGSQSSSDSSSSSSSSSQQQGPTLDETLALLAQKAASKKAKVTIPEYREVEYLGPSVAVYTYLGAYASNGTVYYFVNEQGYFCYQYANDALNLISFELDPTTDLYADVLYSPYDLFNDCFAQSVTLVEETENAFVVDVALVNDTKAALASVLGYNASSYASVTAAQATIDKDASAITLDVTFNGTSEPAIIESFGTFEDADALAFIAAIPPYEPVVAWPVEDIAAAFEAKGAALFDVPAFEGEGFSYVVDSSYSSFVDITVNGADASDLPAYKTVLETAGWTVTAQSSSSYKATKTLGDGIAKVTFTYSTSFGFYIDIYYAKDPLPITTWPAAQIAAAFATKGTEAFAFPALEGEGYVYTLNDSYIASIGVYVVSVTGPASSDLPAYQTAFETAGWTVAYDSGEDEYTATKTLADGIARVVFYYYNSKVTIQIYLVKDPLPAASWPAEDIATYLGVEITDVVPAYEGEATGYQFFEEYGTVIVSIEAGTESNAIEAYQTALGNANYVPFRDDSYGDLHLLSENYQINVCVYYYGEGQIAIQFAASSAQVYNALPVTQINTFLSDNDLGFEITAEMFAELGITFYAVEIGKYYNDQYNCLELTVNGNLASQLDSALASTLTAAGFQYDSDEEYWYNSNYSEVSISYSSNANTTTIFFGE